MSSPEDNEFFNSLLNRSWQLIKGSLPGLPVSVSQCITSIRKWWVKPCWLRVSNSYCLMTGWWFQTFFIFHNIWDNPSHWHIFQDGWNHQPDDVLCVFQPYLVWLVEMTNIFVITNEEYFHGVAQPPTSIYFIYPSVLCSICWCYWFLNYPLVD